MGKYFLNYISSVETGGRNNSEQEIRKPFFPHLTPTKNLNKYWDGCGLTTRFGVTTCLFVHFLEALRDKVSKPTSEL